MAACLDSPSAVPRGLASPGSAEFTLSDAVHGGNAHFYWLPPMVPSPTPTGTFDASVSPVVSICQLANNACVGAPVATFTMSGGGSTAIRVDPTSGQYITNWDTGTAGLPVGAMCRISVSVAGAIVGFADVSLIANGSARNQVSGDFIPLVDGRTLPIKFRIEQGMVVAVTVSPNPASVIVRKSTQLTVTLVDAHGVSVTDQPVAWVSAAAGTATVDATGRVSGVSVGSTTVSAVSNGIAGSAIVNVIPPPVASVVVTPPSSTILVGQQVQLSAATKDADGNVLTGRVIDWSAPPGVTVDATGLVTANQTGVFTVTATSEGQTGSAQVTANPAGFTVAALSVGDGSACGVTKSGAAYCWGGENYIIDSRLPARTAPDITWSFVGTTSGNICALSVDGIVYCWGVNATGGLGDGTGVDHYTPQPISSPLHFQQVTDHGGTHCALDVTNHAWCWGRDVGPNLYEVPQYTFASIVGSDINTCGLTADGTPYCWGELYSWYGPTSVPVAIPGGHKFKQIALGLYHFCGLDFSGQVWCWGGNLAGELGIGAPSERIMTPQLVSGGYQWAYIAAGERHTCGITTTGASMCWGANARGTLGDGTTTDRASPTPVQTTLQFTSIYVGESYAADGGAACGMTSDGAVYCWGANTSGQLGDGTTTDRLTPVRVQMPADGVVLDRRNAPLTAETARVKKP